MNSSTQRRAPQSTPPRPSSAPAPRSASKVRNEKAYRRKVNLFLAGTDTASLMQSVVLGLLPKVKWAKRRWVFEHCGMKGVVTPRVDSQGRVGLAFYERRKPKSRFKRDPKKYPYAALTAWLPLPQAYAEIAGGVMHRLDPEEFGEWARKLIEAAGMHVAEQGGVLSQQDWQATLPDPDEDANAVARADDYNPWVEDFGFQHGDRKQRLPRRQERLIYALYVKVMEPRWLQGQEKSRHSLPPMLELSDGYLAQAVRKYGFHADIERVRRAIHALEAAGYIVAVAVRGAVYEKGKRVRAGHYAYLPGDWWERERPRVHRHQHLSVHAPLTALRRLTFDWGYDWRLYRELLQEATTPEERKQASEEVRELIANVRRRRR